MTLPNAFTDKPKEPTDADLTEALGSSRKLWDRLLTALADEYGISSREWHSYSRKAGWALRLKIKKRTIVYLAPHRGSFTASFALGERAVEAARERPLPAAVIETINSAKRFAEGTGVRIDVTKARDILVVEKLVAIKLDN